MITTIASTSDDLADAYKAISDTLVGLSPTDIAYLLQQVRSDNESGAAPLDRATFKKLHDGPSEGF